MEEAKVALSVAIAAHNEENNLSRCLASVSGWVAEIVVVDSASSDRTAAIARQYTSKVIPSDNPPIFHLNKQKALDACRQSWILQLDADEVITAQLHEEISVIVNKGTFGDQFNGYYIPRKNYFLGGWLRKGGQYPDYIIRLFRRGKGRFPSKSVHEQIEIRGPVGYLKHPLLHYPFPNLAAYWKKAGRYTDLIVFELKSSHTPLNFGILVNYIIVKPFISFVNLYFRHLGIIDGWRGFLFALLSAMQHPIAFIKYAKNYGKTLD